MDSKTVKKSVRPRLPNWIRVKAHAGEGRNSIQNLVSSLGLHTVCQSAKCPNIGECWHKRTATFMILGKTCTRNCRFCAVEGGKPETPNTEEPDNIALAVEKMGLKYVVITCVTRDDLSDGGAGHFVKVINAIRKRSLTEVKIEVLTSDFDGNLSSLRTVLDAKPTVFNHNIETVERLSNDIRKKATYRASLLVLKNAYEVSDSKIPIKSGLMVGMGERDDEVEQTIIDLYKNGVSILTIGQYLPPSYTHWPLERYVHPETFKKWDDFAKDIGIKHVSSAPLVRSSYHAEELIEF